MIFGLSLFLVLLQACYQGIDIGACEGDWQVDLS